MADDADLVAEREARAAGHREPTAPTISYFRCNFGRKDPELPKTQVLASFAPRWIDLGWTKVGEQDGKVNLTWDKGGEPVRPGRPEQGG